MTEQEWKEKGCPLKCETCGRKFQGLKTAAGIFIFCWHCAIAPHNDDGRLAEKGGEE